MKILTIADKKDAKFLKLKTKPVDHREWSKEDLNRLVKDMRATMIKADGIGFSANQAGFNLRLFVVELPRQQGGKKFYAILNPEIEKTYAETVSLEEGCLSVPETFGEVERPAKIVLTGFDKNGKKIKIKAWGLLARVFQHEVDHLNGVLFIDKAESIQKIPKDSAPLQK